MSIGIRISTMTSQQQVRNSMQSSQGELARITKQITSTKQSDDFKGLKDQTPIENYLDLRNSLETITARAKNNQLLNHKMQAIEGSVTSLKEIASQVKLLIQQTRDPGSGNRSDTVVLAQNHLSAIKHHLSARFNGQSLFAGSRYDVVPVGDITKVSNVAINTPTANYYKGDNTIVSSQISEEHLIEYGITANNPTFQKMIASLHQLIDGKLNNDPTKYTQAATWSDEADTELSNMISRIGSHSKKIESELKDAEAYVNTLHETVGKIENTDLPMAAAELMSIQTQIQAAYMLLVRINSTSLADYIK